MSTKKLMGYLSAALAGAIVVVIVYLASAGGAGDLFKGQFIPPGGINLTLDARVDALEDQVDTLQDRYQMAALIFCQTIDLNGLDYYSITGKLNWNSSQCLSNLTQGL